MDHPEQPYLELANLHRRLRLLRVWADDRLDQEFDRQYIAEHMTGVIDALLAGRTPPPPPF